MEWKLKSNSEVVFFEKVEEQDFQTKNKSSWLGNPVLKLHLTQQPVPLNEFFNNPNVDN